MKRDKRLDEDKTSLLLVLHALRIKGFADEDGLIAITGLGRSVLEGALSEQAARGLVTHREGRVAAWALTPAGRDAHRALLIEDLEVSDHGALIAAAYEQFLPINGEFKQVCTDWQLRPVPGRDPVPNDHSDQIYDDCVIVQLVDIHDRLALPLADLEPIERFSRYRPRLNEALIRLRTGDNAAFARPLSNSYHDVWMELHEDLLVTLQRTRTVADGS
jgi:hypothetical protein